MADGVVLFVWRVRPLRSHWSEERWRCPNLHLTLSPPPWTMRPETGAAIGDRVAAAKKDVGVIGEPPEGQKLPPLVKSVLPDHFLLRQGTFIQTCAHVEKTLWETVLFAQGFRAHVKEDVNLYFGVRRRTEEILRYYRRSATTLSHVVGTRMLALACRIESGLDTRHLIVHGASFQHRDGNAYEVSHYFRRGAKPDFE